jgi:hypothetical protein
MISLAKLTAELLDNNFNAIGKMAISFTDSNGKHAFLQAG